MALKPNIFHLQKIHKILQFLFKMHFKLEISIWNDMESERNEVEFEGNLKIIATLQQTENA